MKTTLANHRHIVEEIQSLTLLQGIKRLRDWLKENGYEGEENCPHLSILRTSGTCVACRVQVTEPIIIETLENRLDKL